MQLFLW